MPVDDNLLLGSLTFLGLVLLVCGLSRRRSCRAVLHRKGTSWSSAHCMEVGVQALTPGARAKQNEITETARPASQ
jgi:hypothetical protein